MTPTRAPPPNPESVAAEAAGAPVDAAFAQGVYDLCARVFKALSVSKSWLVWRGVDEETSRLCIFRSVVRELFQLYQDNHGSARSRLTRAVLDHFLPLCKSEDARELVRVVVGPCDDSVRISGWYAASQRAASLRKNDLDVAMTLWTSLQLCSNLLLVGPGATERGLQLLRAVSDAPVIDVFEGLAQDQFTRDDSSLTVENMIGITAQNSGEFVDGFVVTALRKAAVQCVENGTGAIVAIQAAMSPLWTPVLQSLFDPRKRRLELESGDVIDLFDIRGLKICIISPLMENAPHSLQDHVHCVYLPEGIAS